MIEIELKYGCNPNQVPARIFSKNGELPIKVLNGKPGYINFLDALNGWQLVKELKAATNLPAATSFKHVSPAGAALASKLDTVDRQMYFVPETLNVTPLASAYIRARGADRMSSFGDFIALSDICDLATAQYIAKEVSDGIIAPGYDDDALLVLKQKRKGNYNIIEIDENYIPEKIEQKDCFGITFEQGRNEIKIDLDLLKNIVTNNNTLPNSAKADLLLTLITLKYTQSNSVCYAKNGQVIGIGAGQQSRIHCTRLAGNKADIWFMRRHPDVLALEFDANMGRPDRDNAIDQYIANMPCDKKESWLKNLTDVALGSDAFFPFGDNIERAVQSGVKFVAQPGGSVRDDNVIAECNKNDIAMAFTGVRLFHH